MAQRRHDYTKISDVKEDSLVNVFGVVKDFKPAAQTRLGSWHVLIKLVDPADVDVVLPCNIFSPCENDLPPVSDVGDVVRFHRLRVERFRGNIQARNNAGYSWLLYHKDTPVETPLALHAGFTLTDEDKRTIAFMTSWASRNPFTTRLCDVTGGNYYNVLVQVVAVHFTAHIDTMVVIVWDGSVPNFNPLHEACMELQLSGGILDAVSKGRAIPVFVYDDHQQSASQLSVGHFALINNVHFKLVQDKDVVEESRRRMRFGAFKEGLPWLSAQLHKGDHFGRGIVPVNSDDPRLASMKKDLEVTAKNFVQQIQASYDQPRDICQSRLASSTLTEFRLQPVTSISDLLAVQTPSKFKIEGKIVAIQPCTLMDSVVSSCGICQRNYKLTSLDLSLVKTETFNKVCASCSGQLTLTYVFRLLVEDGTGRLEIVASGSDAVKFLQSVEPRRLICDDAIRLGLGERLRNLVDLQTCCLTDVQTLDCPDVRLCVKSYTFQNALVYALFGTVLA